MNNPAILNGFIDKELNSDQYFEYFLREASVRNLLEPQEMIRIQEELQKLIEEQVRKYTSGESSSVRVEIAEKLLRSIYYCLGVSLNHEQGVESKLALLKNRNIFTLFTEGIDCINIKVTEAKALFLDVKTKRLQVNNYAYEDTIVNGLEMFFAEYNPRFFAHDTPCSIDYPLSQDIMSFSGIEYMYRYLHYLMIENKFCSYFSNEAIEAILCGYSTYYQEDLLNIYEVVMGNALARILSENDLSELSVSAEDRQVIIKLLGPNNKKDIEKKLYKAFERVCSVMDFNEEELLYLKKTIQPLSVRIKHNLENGCLDKIFVTGQGCLEKEDYSYQSGKQMPNKELRRVISEIKDCRYVSDKIAIVKRKVNNLEDLIEILEDSFWEGEYQEVFPLLSDYELTILRKRITEEQEWGCGNYDSDSWKTALLAYERNEEQASFLPHHQNEA